MGLLRLINAILETELLKLTVIYYLIGIIIWTSFLLMEKKLKNKGNFGKNVIFIACIFSMVTTFSFLIHALYYVGFLPYGMDTSVYTLAVEKMVRTGRWFPIGDPYYRFIHTSVFLLAYMYKITGSLQLSYSVLQIALLLMVIFLISIMASKMSNLSICLSLTVVSLLFLLTPKLMGFDLHQQFLGMVLSIASIASITVFRSKALFILFALIAAVTHFTGVLLFPALLLTSLPKKKKIILIIAFISIFIGYYYLNSELTLKFKMNRVVNPIRIKSHSREVTSILSRVVSGNFADKFIIRALNEVKNAEIALLSWTMLPSLVTSYLILFIISRLFHYYVVKSDFDTKHAIIGFLSLSYISAGVISRALKDVEILRYLVTPSYYLMLIISSIIISKMLNDGGRLKRLNFIILLFILTPYAYSALNSYERMPSAGGVRLAPVTYDDRVEMLTVARYLSDDHYVYSWHDSYIPIEWLPKELKLKRINDTHYTYYKIHEVLRKVIEDQYVESPKNSIFIVNKGAITDYRRISDHYNIIFSGREHIALIKPEP